MARLRREAARWKALHEPGRLPPVLHAEERRDTLLLRDTRSCAVERVSRLGGDARRLLLRLSEPMPREPALEGLEPGALEELRARRLVHELAGFLTGCFTSDLPLIRESLLDVIIEPQRQVLIPGFAAVKQAAIDAGALGCSISGAGPTVFAWAEAPDADRVRDGMVAAFRAHGLDSDSWVSTIDRQGARVVDG